MTSRGASAQPRSEGPARRPALHRELHFFETTSVSVGVMAPTLAMSVTGVAAAAALGRAAPLAFVVAALGVGLVAYGFVRLAGEFSHAGPVLELWGNRFAPRSVFLAGWPLLGPYWSSRRSPSWASPSSAAPSWPPREWLPTRTSTRSPWPPGRSSGCWRS